MNGTLQKFGYPGSLVKEYDYWCLLLRPQQVTLASLVLAAKSQATAFSDLPQAAFQELATVVSEIERSLQHFKPYHKINYLMLMMVDPHVHLHVIPRYDQTQIFDAVEFPDPAWPGPPDLKSAPTVPAAVQKNLLWNLQLKFSGEA